MPGKAKAHGWYAAGTEVPPEKSQAEIMEVIRKRGADQHFSGGDATGAMIGFSMKGRQVRFRIPYPEPDALGREAEIRRRWRCMVIAVKSKFELVAVAESISPEEGEQVFRAEFLANTVLPNGQTVAEAVLPLVEKTYASGKMPRRMLPGLSKGDDDEA